MRSIILPLALAASCKDHSEAKQPILPGLETSSALQAELDLAYEQMPKSYAPRTHHLLETGKPRFTNRLIRESSPYLLQHAHNPVNWYPWSDEAFAHAEKLGRPVLLSVGYSTCHWCHVMERESFEDIEIATFINQNYIAIKVDREERPDIDELYMSAVQLLTGRGGWPMTVIMTPTQEPFFGGTYFPPRDGVRGNRRGLISILKELARRYQNEPNSVVSEAKELTARIQEAAQPPPPGSSVPALSITNRVVDGLRRAFDPVDGGFGNAPKFPRPVTYEFLLHYYRRTQDKQVLNMVTHSLKKMASGGMYDHLAGGFHRYSTDKRWLVPHFEKMLYDNAQLANLYLDAYLVTNDEFFANVTKDILIYVQRDMTSESGGFYSATDADSIGPEGHMEEGYYFTWTPVELEKLLGPKDARLISAIFSVSPRGNFEGRNILHRPEELEAISSRINIPAHELKATMKRSRPVLLNNRSLRPQPLRDEKILTSWNGLMVSAFARAAMVFDNESWLQQATRAATNIIADAEKAVHLRRVIGSKKSRAFSSDYAFFVGALLDLFEASGELSWLKKAIELQDDLDSSFYDSAAGGYFQIGHDHEALLAKKKATYDGAEPSGNSVATSNLIRLHTITMEPSYKERAKHLFQGFIQTLPRGRMPKLLSSLEMYHANSKEIVLVGEEKDLDELRSVLYRAYLPHATKLSLNSDQIRSHKKLVPWLEGKDLKPGLAYVCEQGRCELPTADPATFTSQLRR